MRLRVLLSLRCKGFVASSTTEQPKNPNLTKQYNRAIDFKHAPPKIKVAHGFKNRCQSTFLPTNLQFGTLALHHEVDHSAGDDDDFDDVLAFDLFFDVFVGFGGGLHSGLIGVGGDFDLCL